MFLTVSPNERGIVVIFSIYNEFLCFLGVSFRFCCPLCGCAKTTVTAMTAEVFRDRKPAVHIGGDYAACAQSASGGAAEFFITEACEYHRSFLSLKPDLALVLNTELDHTDYYKNNEEYFAAFMEFCERSESAVVFGDDLQLRELAQKNGYVTFGLMEHNDYTACNIEQLPDGGRAFDLCEQGVFLIRISVQCYGQHNVLNALAAAAVGRVYGLTADEIAQGLGRFGGVSRRFEYLGTVSDARVYSDYAHHPTELSALVNTAREVTEGRVVVVFQPHTYSRTQSLHLQFAQSLSGADRVYLLPVYAAREQPIVGVDSGLIAASMKQSGRKAYCKKNCSALYRKLKRTTQKGDVVIFAGAGTVDTFGREYVAIANAE